MEGLFTDVPSEVIEKSLMVYLSVNDLRYFGSIGIERFKQMAENVIEKRPTRILISGGITTDGNTSKSGILSLRQNSHGSLQASYEPGPDYFTSMWSAFGVNCNGRIICGGGYGEGIGNRSRKVFEFRNNNFVEINPLTTGRTGCASLYIPHALENQGGLLLVAGSSAAADEPGGNKIEYLMVNNEFRNNSWRVCGDILPCGDDFHQMNLLQNKLILTGGFDPSVGPSNKVWQGNISFNQQLRVNWSPLPSMLEYRDEHVAIVIQEKLFCIGGESDHKSSEYFSFDTNRWEKGPDLPFTLRGARAILTKQQNKCFLVGGARDNQYSADITLFDPINGVTNIEGSFDALPYMHTAVLI